MKISPSHSLELIVYVNRKEIEKLPNKNLEGELIFKNKETGQNTNTINIIMKYVPHQFEHLEVEQNPEGVYFGETKEVAFLINSEVRKQLLEYGSSGGRFYGAGKLQIKLTEK